MSKYIGIYVVIKFVNVNVVLEKIVNGLVFNVLFYVENEEYFYEGGGWFFVKNGSSVCFEMDEENGLVKMVVMDGNIWGVRKD